MSTADRRAQEKARRREDILESARAVFAEEGWHRATVDAIAERAQLGKGTIYLYFGGKEAILAELVMEALAELADRLQLACDHCAGSDPEARLRAMAAAYLAFAHTAPDYFRLLTAFDGGSFQEKATHEQQQELLARSNQALELVTQVIAGGMDAGVFLPGDPRQAAGVLWAALNGALVLLSHPVRRAMVPSDGEEFYNATLEHYLRGLSATPLHKNQHFDRIGGHA